jgi:ABC-type transport system involved in multi-copper enzyme maturation permease subunit
MTAPSLLTADAPPHDNSQTGALWQLAGVEARRLLRSPVLLVAVMLSAWLMWRPWLAGHQPHQSWSTETYENLTVNALFLFLAAMVIGSWTVSRERPSTTEEMFTPAPLPPWKRTLAILLSAWVPVTAAIILVAGQQLLIMRAGGVTIGDIPLTVTPSLVEWAEVPAVTLAAYTAGAAAVRLVHSRAIAILMGTVIWLFTTSGWWLFRWFPASLIAPLGSPLHRDAFEVGVTPDYSPGLAYETPGPDTDHYSSVEPNTLMSGGHTIYLLGVAALFATLALARTGRDPRTRWLGCAGLTLTMLGIGMQLVPYGGDFNFGFGAQP